MFPSTPDPVVLDTSPTSEKGMSMRNETIAQAPQGQAEPLPLTDNWRLVHLGLQDDSTANDLIRAQMAADRIRGSLAEVVGDIKSALALSYKHEVEYWLDAPGTDAEKLAKITGILREALAKAEGA